MKAEIKIHEIANVPTKAAKLNGRFAGGQEGSSKFNRLLQGCKWPVEKISTVFRPENALNKNEPALSDLKMSHENKKHLFQTCKSTIQKICIVFRPENALIKNRPAFSDLKKVGAKIICLFSDLKRGYSKIICSLSALFLSNYLKTT